MIAISRHRKLRFSRLFKSRSPAFEGNFFFILGSGRSGNTLVRKILMDNYEVYIPAETYKLAEALDSFDRSYFLDWPDRVRLVLSSFEYQKEFSTISRYGLFPVFQKCAVLPREERNFGKIITCLWEYLAVNSGVSFTLFGDKTPYNMVSINSISRAFPKGKYLFITRHPYDVCVSYVKMGRYASLDDAAHRWTLAHHNWQRLLNRYPNLDHKLISYEELVRNPQEQTHGVAQWLGVDKRDIPLGADVFWGDIDVYDHISGVKSAISEQFIGKGAFVLTHSERNRIRAIVGEKACEFGYDL